MDFSVIIATRNRARLLEATLGHLRNQDLVNARWELIVVDNNSEDETPAVVARAGAHLPVVALREPRAGQNRARNRALEVARGELLVFTDDDVVPDPRWLAELIGATRRWPDHNIFCGRISPLYPAETPEWLRSAVDIVRFEPAVNEGPLSPDLLPYSPNMAFRNCILANVKFSEHIGPQGTDYAMGSETELLRRLRAAGAEIVYVPSARVEHVIQEHQLTIKSLRGRSFRAGRGLTRLEPDFQSARLFGAPRWLWRALAAAWLRYASSVFSGRRTRFELGQRFHYLRGCVAEYGILAREAMSTDGAKHGSV